MERTREQIAADDALTDAIGSVLAAYGLIEGDALLGDFVVVAATHPSERETGYSLAFRDGNISPHVAIGLLTYASDDMRRSLARDDD